MRKLITANFHRFSKDRFSWCVLGIVVILSLGNVFNSVGSFETMAASGYAVSLDEYYFNQAPLIGAFLALLISMFLGTEFSEGTIRNKLCIGHKRDEIFLSNFISCAFASIVLTVVWLLSSGLLFGLIGPLEMEVSKFIGCIFVAVGFAVSFAALYTVIGSLSSNKAMTIIYTFAVFIILVMFYDQKDSGMRIAELRKQKGLTQEQLAEQLNISTSNLGKLERGLQGLSIDLLIEIGIFFGVGTDYILLGCSIQPTTPEEDIDSMIRQLIRLKQKI